MNTERLTCGIFYCRDSAEIKVCGSLQTSSRVDSEELRSRQQNIPLSVRGNFKKNNINRQRMKLNSFILTTIAITIFSCSPKKEDSYWIRECDSTGINCRYVDSDGIEKIPFGKYYHCYTDTFRNIAFVTGENGKGIVAINRQEEKLFNVFIIDNGPDYIENGAFRIIEKNKMGFADTLGNIIIPTIYDFTTPFNKKGLALVNIGGHSESVDPKDPYCEYHTWIGGKWGIINKKGKIIKEIKFDHKWQNGRNILSDESESFEFNNDITIK